MQNQDSVLDIMSVTSVAWGLGMRNVCTALRLGMGSLGSEYNVSSLQLGSVHHQVSPAHNFTYTVVVLAISS